MPVGNYTGDKKDQPSGAYTGDKEGRRTYGDKDESFVPKSMSDEDTRNRLFAAIKGSYRKLSPFRTLINNLVEEYAGSSYGQGGAPRHEIYMNLMNQAVEAYTMSLAANRPRILVSTEYDDLKYFAKMFENAVNNLIKEIGLEKTMRQWVMDAFFCVGIIKVHMADAGLVEIEFDKWMDPGKPFASNVSLDNFVFDMSSKKWSEIQFAGDGYRIPFRDLKASDIYDQKVVSQLSPTSKFTQDQERLELISRGLSTDTDEYEPMIDLMDIWIAREGKIYTFAMDHVNRFEGRFAPLAEMEWAGPEFGPYHLLSFNDVPENIMPSSPASHLNNLSKLANNIMRKQGRKARTARRIHTYPPASHKDAQKVQRAGDDAWVEVQDNGELKEVMIGGVDPNNQGFLGGVIEMFDRMAGNLQVQAGLGASAPTARQEQLVARHAGKKEAQMQYRVLEAATSLIRDLGHLLWTDEIKEIPSNYTIEGTDGLTADTTWTPDNREGDFLDYDLTIDIFSMGYQSPQDRIQNVNETLSLFSAYMQMMIEQGGKIDFPKLLDLYSDLMNEPRLKDVISFDTVNLAGLNSPNPQASSAQNKMGNPMQKTTEHVRHNVPAEQSAMSPETWPAGAPGGQQDMTGVAQ